MIASSEHRADHLYVSVLPVGSHSIPNTIIFSVETPDENIHDFACNNTANIRILHTLVLVHLMTPRYLYKVEIATNRKLHHAEVPRIISLTTSC